MHNTKESTECCPVFDPVPWDNQTRNWTDPKCARKYGHNYIVAFAEV